MARRIHVKGDMRFEEATGSGVLYPGMLLQQTSAGLFKAHAEEGGRAELLVALEDALQGRAVTTAYASGDLVFAGLPVPGTELYMLIASGESGAIDDEFVSAGDGTLIARSSLASAALNDQVICRLQEAFTTLAANTLKKVRIVSS